jgi:hypothetical protein
MGTPSSANLRGALTDETGTGAAVFGTSPTLVTPALGTPASGVLTNATGLPEAGLAVSNSPTNGYFLSAQSGDAGGMTWAAAGGIAAVVDDTTPQVGGSAGFDLQAQLLVGNGGTTGIAISANGEVTMAAQPCVYAYSSSDDSNVTGDGTLFTVDFDTEIFDQNADLSGDTFTAPVTGRYLVMTTVKLQGMTTDFSSRRLNIILSNRTIVPIWIYGGAHTLITDTIGWAGVVDMDSADTFTIGVRADGAARIGDVVSGEFATFVSVALIA